MKKELTKTRDGSHTIFIPGLDVYYRSVHGAVSESLHVFIQHGLAFSKTKFKPLHLLEVGMGTGLNACLTFLHAADHEVHYTALEPFPPEPELLKELDYHQWIDNAIFNRLHQLPFDEQQQLSPHFQLLKLKTSIRDFQPAAQFHLVYYDPFAPRAQPELWTEDIFSSVFQQMHHDGALVTYCAKGDVKRTLKACGFIVQTLPGAPGKREMVRAIKK